MRITSTGFNPYQAKLQQVKNSEAPEKESTAQAYSTRRRNKMNAVGIDVSKGKSMVAALRPMGEVAFLPREFLHTEIGLEQMAYARVS